MVRTSTLLPTLSLFLALTSCDDAAKAPPPPPPPAAPPPAAPPSDAPPPAADEPTSDVAAGKNLYLTACANCHGPDGTGAMMRQMMPKIGDLTSAELHARMDDAAIIKLATEGRDKMPPFGSVFKPEQMKQIVAYVRTLKK